MVLAAAERGVTHVFVPEPLAREASMVPDLTVFGMRSLAQVAAELNQEMVPEAPPVAPLSSSKLLSWRGDERLEELDFGDLRGMADTKYAVEVAAAGGHHLLLSGPKGSGKTSIAERIPTILPELSPEESLELTAIHSLAGSPRPGAGDAHRGALRGASPRRQQGQSHRWRQRSGAAGRAEPGTRRACCSSTSSRSSAPT